MDKANGKDMLGFFGIDPDPQFIDVISFLVIDKRVFASGIKINKLLMADNPERASAVVIKQAEAIVRTMIKEQGRKENGQNADTVITP